MSRVFHSKFVDRIAVRLDSGPSSDYNGVAMQAPWKNPIRRGLSLVLLAGVMWAGNGLAAYPDRFVWVFGWGLGSDEDVTNITRVLDSASRHGINGAVVSGRVGKCALIRFQQRRLN